jgi:hypothetical protein
MTMIRLAFSNAIFLAIIWNGLFFVSQTEDPRKMVEKLSKAPNTPK